MKLNTFKKKNRKDMAVTSFLLLGTISSGIAFQMPGVIFSSLVFTVPLISTLLSKYAIKHEKYNYLNNSSYLREFSQNLFKYINNSNSLEEKRYKTILSLLWINDNNIKMKDITNHFSTNNSKELEITMGYKELLNEIGVKGFTYSDSFIKEKILEFNFKYISKNNYNIFKKVYDDFSDCGLIGKNIYNINYPFIGFLLELQNNILTIQDIACLDKIKNKVSEKSMSGYIIKKDEINDLKHMMRVLNNKENKENLMKLRDFFEFNSKDYNYDNVINLIKKYETIYNNYELLEKRLIVKNNGTKKTINKL